MFSKEKPESFFSDSDGYKYDVVYRNFLNPDWGSNFVHLSNPYSLENIKLWLKLNTKPFSIVNATEYKGKNEKLELYCFLCKNIFNMSWISFSQNQGCPVCLLSKGETKVKTFLNLYGIKYVPQHKFSNCRNKRELPFDFYLYEYNTCIEYDGILHYEDKFNHPEIFKITRKRDKIKTKYCKDNNISLLRIPYWEFDNIEKILQNKLNL